MTHALQGFDWLRARGMQTAISGPVYVVLQYMIKVRARHAVIGTSSVPPLRPPRRPGAQSTIQGISNSTKSKYSCSRSVWYSPPMSSAAAPPDLPFGWLARRPRYANWDWSVPSVRFVAFGSGYRMERC